MKTIVFSDIHSNLEALQEAFRIAEETGPFALKLCLGDTVGYGPYPSECLDLLRKDHFQMIIGNHERMLINPAERKKANSAAREAIAWTEENLSMENRIFIESLPESLMLPENLAAVHGSPNDPDEYIMRGSTAVRSIYALEESNIRVCFFGHTHIPGIFDENGNYFYEPGKIFRLDKKKHWLINPGSIGQPRDRDKRGSFCIFDSEAFTAAFIRFDYNITKTAEAMREKGLPESLAQRLSYGL